jgi:histidyl-tRNA synthetase
MFRAPRGTYDLLPPAGARHLAVRAGLSAPLRLAGYGYVETPVFEDTALFERGVGESTDVVAKEMYTFTDRGGRSLTLRPEGTAGVVRAVVEHHLDQGGLPVKLWYAGPQFRYESPQAGRYRHFTQVGAEALGSADPALDAELIVLAADGYRGLGLSRFRVLVNSLGDATCRPTYREKLQAFLRGLDLDPDTRRRADLNPLRLFDDRRPEVAGQLADAPLITEALCAACREHYQAVHDLLAAAGVAVLEAPRLVRGLDYYTRTTFEFDHPGLGAQSGIGGGGRYDGLSEAVGGPPLPGVGWALGVDRTVLALQAEGVELPVPPACRVFGVPIGPAARRRLFAVVTELRRAGIAADLAAGERGLKGAMKAADRSGAAVALVLGDRDLARGVIGVKDLQSGEQQERELDGIISDLLERLR